MKFSIRFLIGILAAQAFWGDGHAYGQSTQAVNQAPSRAVLVDAQGATYLGGASFATLVKLDAAGATLWRLPLSGDPRSETLAIAHAPDGSILAAGGHANGMGFLTRLRPSGEPISSQSIPQTVRSLAVDLAGSVYLAGDGFLSQRNPDLTTVFERKMDGSVRLAIDRDGAVYAAISSRSGHGQVGKLARAGEGWLWQVDLGPATLAAIAIDPLGSIYVTGATSSPNLVIKNASQLHLAGQSDAIAAKLSLTADLVWSTFLGGSGDDGGTSIAFDQENHPVIGGYSNSADFPAADAAFPWQGSSDGILVWLDADGSVTRSAYYGTNGADRIEAIAIDSQGRMTSVGASHSGPGLPASLYRRWDAVVSGPSTPIAEPGTRLSAPLHSALFQEDFQSGTPGNPPPGWTVSTYLNTTGFALQNSQTFDTLNLVPGGAPLTTVVQGSNTPTPDLGNAAPLRYARYGNQAAVVNFHSSSGYGHGQNANDLWQVTTVTAEDIDPSDGLAHIRFAYSPVLQNPGHALGPLH